MLSVQTNMLAWNAGRQLNINTKKKAKNTEKLSSGYRINRAADDAAGLAVSEKMRRQIRGLKQGSDNITEGISMLQVADGALDEVVSILQRINELSVKAYNDTNTEEDRSYIQSEVTHLITEIDRIADTTTFNEIQVLKGNPLETVQIEADKVYEGELEDWIQVDVPAWLDQEVDDKLENHGYNSLTQETSGKMFQWIKTGSDPITGEQLYDYAYYGPDEGDITLGGYTYTHAGDWTATLDDNATAKISFEGLIDNSSTVEELYQNMHDLLGTAIGVPCGTCSSRYYGLGYGGSVDGYSAYPERYSRVSGSSGDVAVSGMLGLSAWTAFQNDAGEAVNCFDKIKELMKKQAEDTSLTDAQKEAQTKALADEIAQKLCAESYAKMSGITENYDHFDRALQDGKYNIIVYDYRDEQQLTALNASDAIVNKSCVANVTIPYSYLEPGTTAQVNSKLYIVCSSQSIYGDRVPLELPLISADTLGITGYDVARYSEKTTYSDAYKARLEAWDNDVSLQTVNVPEQTVEVPSFKKKMTFVNGEVKIQYEPTSTYKTIPAHSYELRVHNSPKPVPGDDDLIRTVSYDPDSNRQIRDALDYVLMCRATLGAQQNRLEHSYNNNQNKYENMSSAESVIRDTDIAKEMVDFSNNNILEQAGVSVLSQANQSAQMMLQLLQ